MLDAMLAIADKCRPGNGGQLIDALAAIRMCFELLEFMRLVSFFSVYDAISEVATATAASVLAVQKVQKWQFLINICLSAFRTRQITSWRISDLICSHLLRSSRARCSKKTF